MNQCVKLNIKHVEQNLKGDKMERMNRVIYGLGRLVVIASLCFTVSSHAADDTGYATASSDGAHFRVSYKSKVVPLPLNRIHSWLLHVNTLDGQPVEKATISVQGGMPAHRHGLPTQPLVTETGGGDYLVEGLKFSMTGLWQMWFNIRAGNVTDNIKFDIEF